jgi:hypothetical protein
LMQIGKRESGQAERCIRGRLTWHEQPTIIGA